MAEVYIYLPKEIVNEGEILSATAYYRDGTTRTVPTEGRWRIDCLTTGAVIQDWTALTITQASAEFWTLPFNLGGSQTLEVADTISGQTSGATGVVSVINLTSGSWLGEDAAGTLELTGVVGTWATGGEVVDQDLPDVVLDILRSTAGTTYTAASTGDASSTLLVTAALNALQTQSRDSERRQITVDIEHSGSLVRKTRAYDLRNLQGI